MCDILLRVCLKEQHETNRRHSSSSAEHTESPQNGHDPFTEIKKAKGATSITAMNGGKDALC